MPTYQITVRNEDFSCSEQMECATPESALKEAIKAAIAIATDPVSSGKPFFGAEVMLEQGNRELLRYVVALGANRLSE